MGNGPIMQQQTQGTAQRNVQQPTSVNIAYQNVIRHRVNIRDGAYLLPRYGQDVGLYAHAQANGMRVIDFMQQLYGDDVYEMNTAATQGDVIPLSFSRGTMLAQENDVCEFEIAGSSFKTFRKDHKKLKGKNPKMGWFARLMHKWFNLYKKEAAEEARTDATFGNATVVEGRLREDVRTKNYSNSSKRKITISGPGALNGGEYSIENIRQYILACGKQYILEKILLPSGYTGNLSAVNPNTLSQMLPPANAKEIIIRLKGHSRGAVAEIEGAKMLKEWIDTALNPAWSKMIAFDIVQFDPVPGGDVNETVHNQIDINDSSTWASLSGCCSSTVVYSMYQEHNVLQFTPMSVKGTDRIILTPFKHSVGLDRVDRQKSIRDYSNQTAVTSLQQETKDTTERKISDQESGSSAVFVNTAEKRAYSRDALNELPIGVYISDDYGRLTLIRNPADVDQIMDKIYQDKKSEEKRKNIIKSLVREWFAAHPDAEQDASPNRLQ